MFGKLIVGVLTATGMVAGVGVVTTSLSSDDAVVTRIVDGDTFDATVAGRTTTIRLLNIDTPETKDPDTGVECLGPEATARLAQMIPVGSSVSLAYDDERTDRYDRTLAGVYDDAGRLVNAELAREGLGTALVVGGNDRFYGDVLEAQNEARAGARGLYAVNVPCTLPAQVQAATSAVDAAQQDPYQPTSVSDPAELDRAAARAAGLVRDVDALRNAFTGPRRGPVWTALSPDDERRLTDTLTSAGDRARGLQSTWTSYAAAGRERARAAAEQAERDRVAREEAARAQAAQQAARQAEQKAEQRRLAAAAPPAVTEPADAGGSGGGCDPNYTPCVPISAKDLDCGDLPGGPYTVIGVDKHRLDNDDPDNIGCEGNG